MHCSFKNFPPLKYIYRTEFWYCIPLSLTQIHEWMGIFQEKELFYALSRSNKIFDSCEADNGNETRLVATQESENCDHMGESMLCLSIITSLPSCILRLDKRKILIF